MIALAKLQVLCNIVEENNLIAYFSKLFLFLTNKLSREEFSLTLIFILPPTVSKIHGDPKSQGGSSTIFVLPIYTNT